MTKTKFRITYLILFLIFLFVEILIGAFVDDAFIRPYVGDVLVTVLICCLCRVVFPTGVRPLPIYVFLFAMSVEIAQYFDFVKLLGLEGNRILSIALGRTFSVWDIVCYAVGCLLFWAGEYFITPRKNS